MWEPTVVTEGRIGVFQNEKGGIRGGIYLTLWIVMSNYNYQTGGYDLQYVLMRVDNTF